MDLVSAELPAKTLVVAIDPGKATNRVLLANGEQGLIGEPVSLPTLREGIERLRKRRAKPRSFASKDILRAAGLPCLPADSEDVAAKLAKVRDGKPLAPVMLVRPKSGPLVIADGYHRVSASYLLDESTPVHCVLVSVP